MADSSAEFATFPPTVSSGFRALSPGPEDFFGRPSWVPTGLSHDAAAHGFRLAEPADLPSAHAFCEALMGRQLAPLWALASAHEHTQGTAWIHPGSETAISAVFLILPLTWDGEAALRCGRFKFSAPRLDELCVPSEEIAAMYFWFCGGSDRAARRNVMRTTQAWLDGSLAGMRIYGRAASEDGVRGYGSFGFRRLAPERSDLFILGQQR